MFFVHRETQAKIFCIFGFFLWFGLLTYKYFNLSYFDWDLAFFSQAMWGISHGTLYVSLFDKNFLSNHANLIAYVLLPFYKLYPHALTLLFFKLVSFFISAYLLYLVAKDKLGERVALLILIFYLIYPANIFGLIYEFDFENMALMFIMMMYYFFMHDRWLGFFISALFLTVVKENMPLVVIFFGLYGLMIKSDKIRWGLIPMLAGALSFYALAFVFVPKMANLSIGHHPYMAHYSQLMTDPGKTLASLWTNDNEKWLINIMGPLMFLPLTGPRVLFLAAPIIGQHLLSGVPEEHSIRFAYALTLAPFLFLALIDGLAFIKTNSSSLTYYLILFLTVIAGADYLMLNMYYIKKQYVNVRLVENAPYRWKLLRMVPPQDPVVATFSFLPELSQRAQLYSFHKLYDEDYQNKDRNFQLPAQVRWALVDYEDSWLMVRVKNDYDFTVRHLRAFLNAGWVERRRFGDVALYARK